MALKFYTSVKKVETISQNILGLIPTFVGVTAEKLLGERIYSKLS